MSYDITIRDGEDCETCGRSGVAKHFNITYNIHPLLEYCGIDFDALSRHKGPELSRKVDVLLHRLRDPFHRPDLEKLNPKNGWGHLEGLIVCIEEIKRACYESDYPVMELW